MLRVEPLPLRIRRPGRLLHLSLAAAFAVSQFRELCEIADRDRALTETLKKVLKLSKGWETAREHVYKAVDTDNRMRCAGLSL